MARREAVAEGVSYFIYINHCFRALWGVPYTFCMSFR